MRFLLILCILSVSCVNSQKKYAEQIPVGGACEGCDAIYEHEHEVLNAIDTLAGFKDAVLKVKLSGIIYQKDGKTPAKDVVLYAYQTNEKGIYPKNDDSKGWERRHGYIRGWVKTDDTGKYTFYTLRPASYPNTSIEQHIHMIIKEPDKSAYFIDDVTFADDPNLSARTKNRQHPKGGKGIVTLKKENGYLIAKRNIILGKNITDYP